MGNTSTEADEADVRITASLTDVRNNPSLTDYVGNVTMHANLQITDTNNAAETPEQRQFDEIVSAQGLKAALAWRDSRYGEVLGRR